MEKTICFFNSATAWGGGEKWHFDIAQQLNNEGFSVIICAHPKSELLKRAKQAGIKAFGVSVTNLTFLCPFRGKALSRFFKEQQVATIVLNLSRDVKFAAVAAKKAGVERIIYRRGSAIPIKNNQHNRYLFSNILTEVLANSEKTKQTINQNNPKLFPNQKIKVIYNGMDLVKFDASHTQEATVSDKIVLGNIGRLVHQKGQKYLIDLVGILREKGLDFELKIGGTGAFEQRLKKQVLDNKLSDYVRFTGFVDKPKAFISGIDIFVLSSLWEGFGYVLTEAMACQKPVVAFNVSSNPEIVAEGETGFLVDFLDIEQLAEKVLKLAKDKTLRDKLGKAGRKRVEARFQLQDRYAELKEYLTVG